MRVSPDAHNWYVAEVDRKHGGKVKPLIRLIKAWKYYREAPIKSFYLEMRVAKYAEGESHIVYSIDVKQILAMLSDNELPAMHDPMGVAGYIYPCNTNPLKNDALSKIKTAAARAEKALEAADAQNVKAAFDWWGAVYNNKFPCYYL